MRFFAADKIHNGFSFLPRHSVLILGEKNEVLDIKPSAEIDKTKIEFHKGIICPGFINVHCHLELSYLKGKIEEQKGLHDFIKEIEKLKKPADDELLQAIKNADSEMYNNGIAAVGDICNNNSTFGFKKSSKIFYHNFIEVFAFDQARAETAFAYGIKLENELKEMGIENFSIIPHAPYSVSTALLNKISDHAWQNNSILSIHNQESEDENLLFQNKSGKILERLQYFGINTENWKPTGKNSLESTLVHLPRNLSLLLVHNTFTTTTDIEFANEYNKRIYWCFCPNANLYIEKKLPYFELFAEHLNQLTIGTDSYASNYSLSVIDEIHTVLSKSKSFTLEQLLRMATSNGAKFLGVDEKFGSFERGKSPGGVSVTEQNGKLLSKRLW